MPPIKDFPILKDIKLTPLQQEVIGSLNKIFFGGRASGRTTALAIIQIRIAWENQDKFITPFDHEIFTRRHMLETIQRLFDHETAKEDHGVELRINSWREFGIFKIPIKDICTDCPECGLNHVDEGVWAKRPHKTHLCSGCGATWVPVQDTYTRGVSPYIFDPKILKK